MFGGLKARATAAAKSASAAMEDPSKTAVIASAKTRASELVGSASSTNTTADRDPPDEVREDAKDWGDIAAKAKGAFREFDEDKSSTISRARLFDVIKQLDPSVREGDLEELFNELDVDKNGVIDYEEFVDWCGAGTLDNASSASNRNTSMWSRGGATSYMASMKASAAAKASEMKAAAWDLCPLPSASELQRQFEMAASSDDRNRINQLLDSALATQAADVPGVRRAAHQVAKEQLLRAVETEDRTQIKGALISAKRLWATELPEYELATQKYRELAKIPEGWDVAKMVEERKQGKLMVRAEISDPKVLANFQRLFDNTVRMKWTRDRRDDPNVPKGYEVVKVMQVQNEALWTEYVIRQEEIRLQMASKDAAAPGLKARPRCSYGKSCYRKNPEHRSATCHPGDWDWDLSDAEREAMSAAYLPIATQAALREQLPGPHLDDAVNEVFLFHGTNPIAVEKITSDNFSVNFAGSSTGTLYGRGLYFAEHCTKADEYAKADGAGLHTVLLCRVTLGDILYTAAAEPEARVCEDTCMRGDKHSVLGDRIRCRDTFREFVVFDEAQIYANFVVQYRRKESVDLRKRK